MRRKEAFVSMSHWDVRHRIMFFRQGTPIRHRIIHARSISLRSTQRPTRTEQTSQSRTNSWNQDPSRIPDPSRDDLTSRPASSWWLCHRQTTGTMKRVRLGLSGCWSYYTWQASQPLRFVWPSIWHCPPLGHVPRAYVNPAAIFIWFLPSPL